MNLFVLLKAIPDTVEELSVGADEKSLDAEWLRFKLGDSDEHALEQGLLMKERHGGKLTVIALEAPEMDDALFMALAKGADRVVKLAGDFASVQGISAAGLFASWLRSEGESLPPDTLILTQSQASDDLGGEIAPFLADMLELPYMSVVTSVQPEGGRVTVVKEFSGGLRGEFSLSMPAVLGIQSAEKPPRYVPIAKVRAVKKAAQIEAVDSTPPAATAGVCVEPLIR